MASNSLTRRQLFRKFRINFSSKDQPNDPLFEKYSRKVFNGRKYTSATKFYAKDTLNSNYSERVNPVLSGLNPYLGTWSTREAIHLLNRTGFGFKKNDVDTLINLSFNSAIDLVLNVSNAVPNPPINFYQNNQPDENGLPYGADWTNNAFNDPDVGNDTNYERSVGLAAWQLGLALNQDITIREKMTLFWYHLMPIDFDLVMQSSNEYCNTNSARICYKYMKMMRDNATGNFKSLVRQMATQPAMMFYLNNQSNKKGAPDENFAREIMELFTLGKDNSNIYAQSDVVQAAKVLTGWKVQNLNSNLESTNFIANRHDDSDKQFSSFFNNTIIPNSGANEIDLFIDMIFAKSENVSRYICRRLYRFFVYYDIDSNIETNIIEPLAAHFVANNFNIKPVLEKLFKSEHFFDMANRGVYIKSPFDIILGGLRTFNINYNISDPTNHEAQYEMWKTFNYVVYEMDQAMGKIPSVAGWQAFYQKPSFHEYWINSNSIQRRFGILGYILYGFDKTDNGLTTRLEVDVVAFVQQFNNAIILDPNLLVNECIKYLLPIDLSLSVKNNIKSEALLNGQVSDYYWTDAWSDYINNPNAINLSVVTPRLKSLLFTIIQLAEYQLM
jgi:uncharacterized protein (DUF1800 family)